MVRKVRNLKTNDIYLMYIVSAILIVALFLLSLKKYLLRGIKILKNFTIEI